jgi:pimeloyl-ACP methyl ester carboxylesterase
MRLLIVVSVWAVTLFAGGVTVAVARELGSAAAAARIDWTECGARLECAQVQVPLDWDRPDRREITLSVIRHLASHPEQRIGSLFTNFGGPAGSVPRVRDSEGESLDALTHGRFDIVGWDIRGSGESTHVPCFDSEESAERFFRHWALPFTETSSQGAVRKTAALARRCNTVSGDLLSHMSTADITRDLDYLRRLLGDPQLTYLGLSGGTLIGQTYANMFPHRVRAMVLDGLVDVVAATEGAESLYEGMLVYSDQAFKGFLTLCDAAGPARCALAGQGPAAARAEQVLTDLRRGAIPAPSAEPPGDLTYGDALAAIVLNLSAGPETWPEMGTQLDAAARGDGSDLATRGRIVTSAFASQVTSPGLAAVALTCADSPAKQGPQEWPEVIDRLTRVSFIYGPVVGWWRWAPCASWLSQSANRYLGPWNAVTENPILVIGTRFDPNTPLVNAIRTAGLLGNAVLLIHDGYSHTSPSDPSACVKRATGAYLIDLATPPPGTVCPSDHAPFDPNFVAPLHPTSTINSLQGS